MPENNLNYEGVIDKYEKASGEKSLKAATADFARCLDLSGCERLQSRVNPEGVSCQASKSNSGNDATA